MDIEKRINEIFSELVEIRRDFHANPELSEKEFRTSDKICEILKNLNIEYTKNIAETGIVGIIRGKKGGKTVAARADIDALPIVEKNDVPYKSKNCGVMHACGHDIHTTVLIGVAKILKELESEFEGNVKLFFQPAEETVGGAKRMVQEGCLKNPDVDYVVGLHVQSYIDAGKIELKYGKLNAQTDELKITILGKSGHGAYPDTSIDAIVIAANVITALQTLVSRNISPLNSVVLSLGQINGGTKNNIICDSVEIKGILRTLDSETRAYAIKRIQEITTNICDAYGGNCLIEIKDGYRYLINSNEVVDIIYNTAKEIIGEENIQFKEMPSMGGEDFSYFMDDNVKGAFYHLGCGNKEKEITSPLHSDSFDVDENCIKTGVLVQVKSILALLDANRGN
ncbi:MAG TPA: amidohydrolase [Clostridiales bacterium]|nr:amidohydrolase [Clostridiales bacterium]